MRFCSVILFYFSFNYIFFNGNTRYLLVEIDAGKEKQEVLVPENIEGTKSAYSKCWGNVNLIFVRSLAICNICALFKFLLGQQNLNYRYR